MDAYKFKVGDSVRITAINGFDRNRFKVGDIGVVENTEGWVTVRFSSDTQISSGDNIELATTPADHIARLAAVMVWWRQVCPLNSGDFVHLTANCGVEYAYQNADGRLRSPGFATLVSRAK